MKRGLLLGGAILFILLKSKLKSKGERMSVESFPMDFLEYANKTILFWTFFILGIYFLLFFPTGMTIIKTGLNEKISNLLLGLFVTVIGFTGLIFLGIILSYCIDKIIEIILEIWKNFKTKREDV